MSKDVFESWKDQRFIIAPSVLVEGTGKLIVLTNIAFWNEHYEKLKDWCDAHQSETIGMTVEVPNEETLLLFVLRWA